MGYDDIDYSIAPPSGEASFIGYERVNRRRWWRYSLSSLIVTMGTPSLLYAFDFPHGITNAAFAIGLIAYVIVQCNLNARRYHDMGIEWRVPMSVWALPAVVLLSFVQCGFAKSDPSVNRWGPASKVDA